MNLLVGPLKRFNNLTRTVPCALQDQGTLLNEPHHINLRVELGGVALKLINELLGQNVIRGEAKLHHSLEVIKSMKQSLLVIIVGQVLSGWHIASLELSLAYELYIAPHVLELKMEIIKQLSELGVPRLLSGSVQGFDVPFGDTDELLIHLVVLLSDEVYNLHCPGNALADLVELEVLAGCLSVRGLDIVLGQVPGL